jgi:hypothetical protein
MSDLSDLSNMSDVPAGYNLADARLNSSADQILRALGASYAFDADVAFCSRLDIMEAAPILTGDAFASAHPA